MNRTVSKICAAILASAAAAGAQASASTGVNVTDFRVTLTALAPGAAPSVSFDGAGGSDAIAASYPDTGLPYQFIDVSSSTAFGPIGAVTTPDPLAGGSAWLAGDVFGAGASAHTDAYASSRASSSVGESQVGLVNDVEIAYFILAPETRMTISANVTAWATATGATPLEYADGGMLMEIGDETGGGAQEGFSIVAAGANPGHLSDFESGLASVTYINDTDAPIVGTFSGYIESYATSGGNIAAVPEPASLAMMLAGACGLAAASRRRKPR